MPSPVSPCALFATLPLDAATNTAPVAQSDEDINAQRVTREAAQGSETERSMKEGATSRWMDVVMTAWHR